MYSCSPTTTPSRVMASTPRPSVSTSVTLGRLKACRYSSWKQGRLQNCRYQGLRASAVAGSSTISSTRDRICSIFSKSASSRTVARSWSGPRRLVAQPVDQLADDVGPAVHDEVLLGEAPEVSSVKFSIRSRCQPGSRAAAHEGSVGRFARTSMDEGVRWKTKSSPAEAATWGTHLDRRGTRSDDADALVGQAAQPAVRVAARVRVVPSAGVEGVTPERLDARDAGELGPVERAVAHHEEPGRHPVASVGQDGPARAWSRPTRSR